jgi:predicted nucleic acid-binding protein
MKEMTEPVYIDSNIFIFPVIRTENHSHKVSKSKEILARIETGKLVAYTSWLTWDEVVWVVMKTLGKGDSLQVGQKLLNFPNLRFIDVNETIISKAQIMSEKYELDPRDALHCSSALYKNLKIMISDDQDLDRCKEIKRTSLQDI